MSFIQQEIDAWQRRNWPAGTASEMIPRLDDELTELAEADDAWSPGDSKDEIADEVGDLVILLRGYCGRMGIDFDEAVGVKWARVKQRRPGRVHRNNA